ncbi:helix-turn-helix domain-containing protein [Streptomyces microflavus]|uniref:helix-turn-helix domain-containing protein n=1 Tax=Streptomyces microflavus TaxID=1919 RepID=UPI002E34A33C|nr:helix-turn-helix domain-containing protein [Streptomyces microflavus]WSS32032.1 helix-turn-helix domain-containing protein [Streptomyces microflavus]WST19421.1 helix-turn-helix domain-containing protein [Streptomyces microflavus]
MNSKRTGRTPESALAELRRRLEAGLVSARLNKSQLAGLAGLSRGTVQEAFKAGARVPSTFTVAALARVLKLSAAELQELRRDAAGGVSGEGPGRPIGQWEPHALEVHPAGHAPGGSRSVEQRVLPGYVRREHDRLLAEVVREAEQGRSRMVVLVGESSTGKTRACWEAVQPLAEKGWRLWHPFDPTRAKAALEELQDVGPRTVVWLNEAQHYFGDRLVGEQVAAAVHALLIEPERAPVLVLGTLWHQYFTQYTALPGADGADPHSRVRELLSERTVSVPEAFNASELAVASSLARGDVLLADALTRARADGRLCQDLAGAPMLLKRYENGSPAARALLEAAMDARRLGFGLHIPQAFLTDAALDYVHDSDSDQLIDDWAEKAYAELATKVHGKRAPLARVPPRQQQRPPGSPAPTGNGASRIQGPVFRLADYLEQHGRSVLRHRCPPASFWHATLQHITQPDVLDTLARAAERYHRLQWAHHLHHRASHHYSRSALVQPVRMHEEARGLSAAETFRLATNLLVRLALMREKAGDHNTPESLHQQANEDNSPGALVRLALMREKAGDHNSPESLYRRAADFGNDFPQLFPDHPPSRMLHRLWPYGLDPDGTPTGPWSAESEALPQASSSLPTGA